MSRRLGRRRPPQAIYLIADAEIPITAVTVHSFWQSKVWRFDSGHPGRQYYSINWALGCSQAQWECPRWQQLLNQVKRILLSLRDRNLTGRNHKPGSLVGVGVSLRTLIHWMYDHGYANLADLNRQVYSRYIDFLVITLLDEDAESAATNVRLSLYIEAGPKIFSQSPLFDKLPQMSLKRHPLAGESSFNLAKRLTDKGVDRIPPMPDEVFDPVVKEALRWVKEFSKDILDVVSIYCDASEETLAWHSNNYAPYIYRRLINFRFNGRGDEKEWRPPLSELLLIECETEEGTVRKYLSPTEQLGELIADLVGAAACVIQALTAIRISEFAGLKSRPYSSDGLPACVKATETLVGPRQAFYLVGEIYKGRQEPEPAEWIMGLRPRNSSALPDAVEAVLVLDKLFRYWRDLVGTDELSLSVRRTHGLARTAQTTRPVASHTVRTYQQRFVSRHVCLPIGFSDWRITTHQFRKKFANDILRSDPSTVAEVALHFHHLSDHMVSDAYFGSDPSVTKLVEDTALQRAAADIVRIVFGAEPAAGKMSDFIRGQADIIKRACADVVSDLDRVVVVEQLLLSEAVSVAPSEYGDCFFRSETARCHHNELGYFDRTAKKPNFAERSPDLCCECANLCVLRRSQPYWLERFEEASAHYLFSIAAHEYATAHFALRRMGRAAAILRGFGLELELPKNIGEDRD